MVEFLVSSLLNWDKEQIQYLSDIDIPNGYVWHTGTVIPVKDMIKISGIGNTELYDEDFNLMFIRDDSLEGIKKYKDEIISLLKNRIMQSNSDIQFLDNVVAKIFEQHKDELIKNRIDFMKKKKGKSNNIEDYEKVSIFQYLNKEESDRYSDILLDSMRLPKYEFDQITYDITKQSLNTVN